MAANLIYDLSTRDLKAKIARALERVAGPFPASGKLFLAVATIQGFDGLPKIVEKPELDDHIDNGCLELNRGLVATKSLTASFYARELAQGGLYPGTQTAYGHGIYLAETSIDLSDNVQAWEFLPRQSEVAKRYATGEIGGIIVRAALKPKLQTMELGDLYDVFRDDRNRAARAGIEDVGTYAAAIGLDAFYVDGAFDYCEERMWVVLSRPALVIQRFGLKSVGHEAEIAI